jgi:sulfotransferase family protein
VQPSCEGEDPASVRAAATPGRLPNLIIAGVNKSGTTSLFHYLGQHPDICGSDLKELAYFGPLWRGGELDPIEDYTGHFRHCAGSRYAMEATPGYFFGGRRLARGIRETCPDAHIVISLRSPIERCWSWFRFTKSRLQIPKEMSFDAYLDRCEALRRAGVDEKRENQPFFWGLSGGCYDEWFDAWAEEFGHRLHVVFFEDLATDPAAVVRGICRWLDLNEVVVDQFEFPVENKTEEYRAAGLQRVAVAVNRRGERFFRRHRLAKHRLRAAYFAVNRQPSQDRPSLTARARLADFYRPHDARLTEQLALVGAEAPAWLRDGA